MSDPSLGLQAAIVAKLKGNAPLTALVADRIYDDVPASAVFPYVSIGPVQVLPDKADCIDGVEIFPQIDAWARTKGSPAVKRIGAAIIAALDDQDFTVAGSSVVVFELQSANYIPDPDGITHHGVLTFHSLVQAQS